MAKLISLEAGNTYKLKPGKYVFTDPCYVLKPRQLWDEICTAWYVKGSSVNAATMTIEHKGKTYEVFAADTAYGDGCYDFRGKALGVDAGMLGIVPFELAEALVGSDELKMMGSYTQTEEIKDEISVRVDDNQDWFFGNEMVIDTSNSSEDDDWGDDDEWDEEDPDDYEDDDEEDD